MKGIFEDFLRGAGLDNATRIHHGDPVGDTRHDTKIMRDQNDPDVEFLLNLRDQQQDLCLNRHVECGCRFVRDQQARIAHQGHGDHDPLAQPARELVGVLSQTARRRGNADLLQQIDRPLPRFLPAHVLMTQHDFFELIANRIGRVERRHRVLEDHRHPIATNVGHLRFRKGGHILAMKFQRVGTPRGRRRQQPHHRKRGERLSAT